jgi:hypothetical protein
MGSNGNGGNPPIRFPNTNAVPIIGQPFTIKSWFPTVLLVCNCGQHEPIMVPKGGGGVCPSCQRIFSIQVIQGTVNFGIGIAAPDSEKEETTHEA